MNSDSRQIGDIGTHDKEEKNLNIETASQLFIVKSLHWSLEWKDYRKFKWRVDNFRLLSKNAHVHYKEKNPKHLYIPLLTFFVKK